MSELMLILAEEWQTGVLISIAVCLISYLVFSVMLVRSCRKNKYDVGVSAMIPFVNIVIFIKNSIYKRRKAKMNLISFDDEEEFEL